MNPFVLSGMKIKVFFLSAFFLLLHASLLAQDTAKVFSWNVHSKKVTDHQYELIFQTLGSNSWQLYAPNQTLSDIPTATLSFSDSAIVASPAFQDSGTVEKIKSPIFEGTTVKLYEQSTAWRQM